MTDAITREEKLLVGIADGSGSGIEPITREEMFLAKLAGQDVQTPEPITRKEKLLNDAILVGGSGGGITPTGTIKITQNGDYNVTRYASANVNVPLKEEQTKAVTVTANGTTEVVPDSGKTLSKVTVEVDVPTVSYTDGNEVEY